MESTDTKAVAINVNSVRVAQGRLCDTLDTALLSHIPYSQDVIVCYERGDRIETTGVHATPWRRGGVADCRTRPKRTSADRLPRQRCGGIQCDFRGRIQTGPPR